MFQRLSAIGIAVALTCFALPVFGQEDKDEQADIAILEFETFNVSDEVVEEFYGSLEDGVNEHEEMNVTASREANVNDLVLTLGCEDVNAECLSGLDEYVEGDGILFGSIEQSEGVYMVSMQLFEFEEGEFTREIDEETVEAEEGQAADKLEVLIEGFLYGNVGSLEVTVEGADDATVSFDGEELGKAPLSAKKLPLGDHVVTLTTDDGREETREVTLRRGSTAEVDFELEQEVEQPAGDEPVASGKSPAPGWITSGAGAAGLVLGILSGNRAQRHNAEAASMICGDALCADASANEAREAQSDMNSAHTMSVVGYSAAAVGLAAGGYLLYDAYTSGDNAEKAGASAGSAPPVRLGVGPTADGASMGISIEF
ncbi:MAG: PEGA domain-containing protein [Persicimonas sp.]